MNKLSFKLLVLTLTTLILVGCPDKDFQPDATLTIINNSNMPIINYFDNYLPSDTLLPANNFYPTTEQIEKNIILENSQKQYTDSFIKSFEELYSTRDKKVILK